MTYENVLLEQPEPGIYLLTVNRPKVLNALNAATVEEIGRAVAQVPADGAARALLITGAGEKAFVAGADIAAMRDMTPLQARRFASLGDRVLRGLEQLPVPVIAVVNGFALGGGCELAMSCDWILASERAVFGQPEVNLGILPGFGGTQRLTRLVGRGRAMELVTTGRQVKAAEALAMGLVNHVFPPESLMDEALAQARTVAAKGPIAVAMAKQAVQQGAEIDLDAALVLETELFAVTCSTDDQKEGMSAFLEKRPPSFQGR